MPVDVFDSPYSWVVAAACSLMYFVMYGLARASGLLFVATLSYYDTNRETASFPFTLACALRYLGGPLAGYLAGRFGIRFVILLGCVMSFVGVGACFAAENILMVAVLCRGLYGLGSSFSSSQLPQMNNLYFHKHLTKSNGVSYAGAALAGIVLPPLIEILLNEYGIKGTYLLLSGLALNSIPVGMLMKEPPVGTASKVDKVAKDQVLEDIKANYIRRISNISLLYYHTKNVEKKLMYPTTQNANSDTAPENTCEQNMFPKNSNNRRRSSIFLNHISDSRMNIFLNEMGRQNSNSTVTFVDSLSCNGKTENFLSRIKEDGILKTCITSNAPNSILSICMRRSSIQTSEHDSYKKETAVSYPNNNGNCQNTNTFPQNGVYFIDCSEPNIVPEHKIEKEGALRELDIFFDIQFLLICFTASINGFYCFVLPTILNDFALDKNISLTDSTCMLMVMSVMDMLGRVGFGWVTDSGFMSLANFCAVCFFVLALSLAFVVWSSEMITMYAILSVMGLSLGIHTPLPACLITKYVEPERYTMANASFDILSVPFLLLTSTMIGFFRDEMGSYDWFVYILCIISFACCIMMLILPYIERRKTKTVLVIA